MNMTRAVHERLAQPSHIPVWEKLFVSLSLQAWVPLPEHQCSNKIWASSGKEGYNPLWGVGLSKESQTLQITAGFFEEFSQSEEDNIFLDVFHLDF